MITSENLKKSTGATFTPTRLAQFLARRIACYCDATQPKRILDPACGDGVLLNAASNILTNVKEVSGYDTNPDFLKVAQLHIDTYHPNIKGQFLNEDFIEMAPSGYSLFPSTLFESHDIVIANPPYVRTQILGAEKSRRIAKQFNLTGRVDLYYPFIIGMTNCLKVGGILGVITSNRYLTTKSGADIRHFLLDNYDILEVIDLGDTKLFNAAVLPAIFIGKKKRKKNVTTGACIFGSVYEVQDKMEKTKLVERASIYDILNEEQPGKYRVGNIVYEYKRGIMKHPSKRDDIWSMTSEAENNWINTINEHAAFRIGGRFKVRVGIKSCADNVFLADWSKENIIPEAEVLHPLISSENINPWHFCKEHATKVLYPYHTDTKPRNTINLEDFPLTKAYLEIHRKQLESRKYLMEAHRAWYEMWVPQKPYLWKLPKVVFPDISLEPRFCYDDSGAIVNGNCYWIVAQSESERQLLLLIEGICNSETMTHYHDLCFNNKLYSGRRRYLSQYIERYPIPDPNSKYSKEIIQVVEALNATDNNATKTELEVKLEILVKSAFGILD